MIHLDKNVMPIKVVNRISLGCDPPTRSFNLILSIHHIANRVTCRDFDIESVAVKL
jgi:hypothetical protein